MRPTLVAPTLRRMWLPGAGPLEVNTSARVITIFTGRPDFSARRIAAGSRNTVVLPPKPPPISAGMVLIRDGEMPSCAAVRSRMAKWPWLDTHSRILPSSP